MEELLLEAEVKQAEATRRCELIRGLAVHGLPDDAQLPAHWDSLWALFADTDYPPQCALGVCFNLLLVRHGLRPACCIQDCDRTSENSYVYDRALTFAQKHFAVTSCRIGHIISLPKDKEHVAKTLQQGVERNQLDTAVGQVLGYSFAGELLDYHRQQDRFSVCIKIEQSSEEWTTLQPSPVLGMVGTRDHSLGICRV